MFFSGIFWRRWYYRAKHQYFTVNNMVLMAAGLIALSWAWGSVSMMQRNYALQRKLDGKERELVLHQLEVETLEYQKNYYQSPEYQEIAARTYLDLANPGEKVLLLPPNSNEAKQTMTTKASEAPVVQSSNMQQWIDFLSGKNAERLHK
jgi:hypothetical protein